MKYASIEETNRDYIGVNWCKKFLRSINIILNVTSGVVAKERDFFNRAYGKSPEEFIEILTMPDDFIRYRDFFEKNSLTSKWKHEYSKLSIKAKENLLKILSSEKTDIAASEKDHEKELDTILSFYSIKKSAFERNKAFFKRKYGIK